MPNASYTGHYDSIKNSKYTLQSLIDNVESVLPQRISKNALRMFLYTEARLLKAYNNAKEYHLREQLIIKGDENTENRLTITSKVDKSENDEKLLEMVNSFNKYHSNINDVGINHLIKKIELTEMIRMNLKNRPK